VVAWCPGERAGAKRVLRPRKQAVLFRKREPKKLLLIQRKRYQTAPHNGQRFFASFLQKRSPFLLCSRRLAQKCQAATSAEVRHEAGEAPTPFAGVN
jgi:hypothetical protein